MKIADNQFVSVCTRLYPFLPVFTGLYPFVLFKQPIISEKSVFTGLYPFVSFK